MITALLLAVALDTVAMRPHVHAQLAATPTDSLSGWCATEWHRDPARETVYLDDIRRGASTNPECGAVAAVVLVGAVVVR